MQSQYHCYGALNDISRTYGFTGFGDGSGQDVVMNERVSLGDKSLCNIRFGKFKMNTDRYEYFLLILLQMFEYLPSTMVFKNGKVLCMGEGCTILSLADSKWRYWTRIGIVCIMFKSH